MRSVNLDRYPEADYTPNDIGPPDRRFSYEEQAYRDEFAQKLAEGRDLELEMLQERIDWEEERLQDCQNDLIPL